MTNKKTGLEKSPTIRDAIAYHKFLGDQYESYEQENNALLRKKQDDVMLWIGTYYEKHFKIEGK